MRGGSAIAINTEIGAPAALTMPHLDPEARHRLLAQKIAEQAQERERRAYLAVLPADLRAYLEARETIPFHPNDGGDPLAGIFWPGPGGWEAARTARPGVHLEEFAWPEKVLAAAERLTDARHDAAPAWFWPILGAPVFRAEFGWARENLRALFAVPRTRGVLGERRSPHASDCLAVVAEDRRAGLIIDNYAGSLEHDPNPDEVVFELVLWGFASAKDAT